MNICDDNMAVTFSVVKNNMNIKNYNASYFGNTNQLFWTVKFGVQIEAVDGSAINWGEVEV